MQQKTALITGITGQTGSYLAEHLLSLDYKVCGLIRRASNFNTQRIEEIRDDVTLFYGDMDDPLSLRSTLTRCDPDEIYNLAAQSHVKVSFDVPVYTVGTVAMGALHMLEAARDYRDSTGKEIRYYQASSSEMFGGAAPPQNETTTFMPRSPYACAKVYAYHQTVNYRQAYGLHASNGILFNHESPRRGETFVTRKITRAATRIKVGLQDELRLGNLDALRDWGFAGDYVKAMHAMVQIEEPDDYVIGTGAMHSVHEWLEWTFEALGLEWQRYVHIDPKYLRPTEVDALQADPRKAEQVLGWKPQVGAKELCLMMVESDLKLAEREKKCS